jgi:hypothetical protein
MQNATLHSLDLCAPHPPPPPLATTQHAPLGWPMLPTQTSGATLLQSSGCSALCWVPGTCEAAVCCDGPCIRHPSAKPHQCALAEPIPATGVKIAWQTPLTNPPRAPTHLPVINGSCTAGCTARVRPDPHLPRSLCDQIPKCRRSPSAQMPVCRDPLVLRF